MRKVVGWLIAIAGVLLALPTGLVVVAVEYDRTMSFLASPIGIKPDMPSGEPLYFIALLVGMGLVYLGLNIVGTKKETG